MKSKGFFLIIFHYRLLLKSRIWALHWISEIMFSVPHFAVEEISERYTVPWCLARGSPMSWVIGQSDGAESGVQTTYSTLDNPVKIGWGWYWLPHKAETRASQPWLSFHPAWGAQWGRGLRFLKLMFSLSHVFYLSTCSLGDLHCQSAFKPFCVHIQTSSFGT